MAAKPNPFAEHHERARRLKELLAAAPVVDVWGVVAAPGVGAGKSPGEPLWEMLFEFAAWRIGRGDIQTRGMTVRHPVTDEQLKAFRVRIEPHDVWHVRAAVVPDSPNGKAQARAVEFGGSLSSDDELNREAKRLQEPVTFLDAVLGTFTLDRRINWYEGTTDWNGQTITLDLHVSENGEVAEAAAAARTLCVDPKSWGRRINEFAVAKLLSLKNFDWLGEDEAEVSAAEFVRRMKLTAITVWPDGDFDFWHDDGDLFSGHSIQISGSLSEGPTRADIPG